MNIRIMRYMRFSHVWPGCFILLALYLVLLASSALAADTGYEIAGGAGRGLNDLKSTEGIFLGAWTTEISKIFELRIEPNVEYIAAKSGKSMVIAGVSPVLRLAAHGNTLNPFLDVGVGVSLGSKARLADRDFGSNFFFSPTAGAGVKFGRSPEGMSLFVRWLHHSNAYLFQPNQGIDSLYLLMGWRF